MLIKSIKTSLASLCAGLAFAASGSVLAADPGITDTTITLGMSAPFSGPNGAYGKEMKEGALAYFAQLNANGGINGKKVELVTLDDGYETERTVANTRKLINEHKVFALMAFYGSSPTTEAMKVFSEAKVPLWVPSAAPAACARRSIATCSICAPATPKKPRPSSIIWSAWASPTSQSSTRTTDSASRARTASWQRSPTTS